MERNGSWVSSRRPFGVWGHPSVEWRTAIKDVGMDHADCRACEYERRLTLVDSCIPQMLNDRGKPLVRFDEVRKFVDDDDGVSIGEVR